MADIGYALAPRSRLIVWHAVLDNRTFCRRNADGWTRRVRDAGRPDPAYICSVCQRVNINTLERRKRDG